VRPTYVSRAAATLRGSGVNVATVIAFPEGTAPTASKIAEAQSAVAAGATELDVMLNRGVLQARNHAAVSAELAALREACPKSQLKLILETSALSEEEIRAACELAYGAGWEYVKTSTGFCGRGASMNDVQIMSAVAAKMQSEASDKRVMKVKASGGIRTLADARAMVGAGASRIGASAGVKIVEEEKERDEQSEST
jgi:deoxyribose-phosphate aldolase